MDQNLKWFYELKAQEITKLLLHKEYDAILVKDLNELKNILISKIPNNTSIVNDSTPFIKSLNLKQIFSDNNHKIYNYKKDREAILADNFIVECDFVTENGELIFLDNFASAASIFGPNKIFAIVGINKFVKNLIEAEKKMPEILEIRNHFNDTNNSFGIIHHGRKFPNKYTVLVVPENIGF